MNNPYESPLGGLGEALRTGDQGHRKHRQLATLLMRLLGVYMAASGIAWGCEGFYLLAYVVSEVGLSRALAAGNPAVARAATSLVYFAIGLYLLLGGQWVLDKLLTPVGIRDLNDDAERDDGELANPGQPQSPPSADQPGG